MVSRPVNTLARLKQELPSHCTSRHVVRVRFGETDLMGIVHHATYISYFEVGRVEYMRRRGLDYHSWTELGIHLPVVEVHVRYRKSARFDELLCIETRLTELGRVRVRFDYQLFRDPAEAEEELVAEGYTVLACVDAHHVPRRIPQHYEAILRSDDSASEAKASRSNGAAPSVAPNSDAK
jgi:acyl-CoA thioester hydrolase